MAFDEARFGLINWHRKRYCPKGYRPPYIVHRRYEWSYLYAAVDPDTGESVCAYFPHLDKECLGAYLEHLSEAYAEYRVVLVLDNAPSHNAKELQLPENIELLALPTYSPELNPVERWFQEFRRALSNRIFKTIPSLQQALTEALEPYWRDPGLLRSITGFPWWKQAIEKLRHQSP